MRIQLYKFIIFLSIINGVKFVVADPPITPNERAAIKKFRPTVENLLTHDYMNTDVWLLRWIRAKKLDLSAAKDLLTRSLEWRKQNKIDDITEESLNSPFAKEFPITLPGVDKDGRPYYIHDWSGDLRKALLTGKRKELLAYKVAPMELVERKVRELNIHKNNSEWLCIHDFNKFTRTSHMCVQCLRVYLEIARVEELGYPLGVKQVFAVNAPRIFQIVLDLISPVLGSTAARISTYTADVNSFRGALLAAIPAHQLPSKYGGTLKV